MAEVNIVIINYNNFNDTIECLESVLRLEYPSYQIILIDNNSENDSFEVIRNWVRRSALDLSFFSYYFDGTKYIEREKYVSESNGYSIEAGNLKYPIVFIQSYQNLGFSGGNNVGIKFSLNYKNPEYFWFLNNDTVVDSEALNALVETSNSDEEIGAVGSKILYHDHPSKIQCLGGYDIKYGYAQSGYDGQADFSAEDFEVKGYISGASLFMRKEIVDKVGMWDEKYFMSVEDMDYCVRMRKAGFKLFFSSQSNLYHKDGASAGRKIVVKKFLGRITKRIISENAPVVGYYDYRNWIYFNKKHHGFFYSLFFMLYYFIGNVGIIILFDIHKVKKFRMLSRAFLDAILGKMGECCL